MHLRTLDPGQEMEAEINADSDSRWKLGIITEHNHARQVGSARLESGHLVVRLRKSDAPAGPGSEP